MDFNVPLDSSVSKKHTYGELKKYLQMIWTGFTFPTALKQKTPVIRLIFFI